MIIKPQQNESQLNIICDLIYKNLESKFKVILPTVASCMKLQEMIVDKSENKAVLLPQIVPVINVGIESDNLYQIPNENIEPISRLEQRILIAKIIQETGEQDIGISQALELSTYVMKLFDELVDSKITIDELSTKAIELDHEEIWHDLADHWRYRSDFLKKIYDEWQKVQLSKQKIDFASFRQHMINVEIQESDLGEYNHIIAGIFPQNQMIERLCNKVAQSKDSYFITPHYHKHDINNEYAKSYRTHSHFAFQSNSNLWGDFAEASAQKDPNKKYELGTFSNIFEEAKNVTLKVQDWISNDNQGEVAIVTNNNMLVNICSNLLDQLQIKYANFLGYKLSETKTYEFFVSIVDSIDENGELNNEKLLILLKSKFLYSPENCHTEYILRKEGSLNENPVAKILNDLRPNLKSHIQIAEKLAPSIWNSFEGKVLGDFLYELLEVKEIPEMSFADYQDFIKSISQGVRYHKNFGSYNVYFVNLEDADLCAFENVICSDLNDDSMPGKLQIDPWMNSKMRDNLGLKDRAEKIGIDWYHFKNLLSRRNLYLTRSMKKNGSETYISRFLSDVDTIGELHAS